MTHPQAELDTASPFGRHSPGFTERLSWQVSTARWLRADVRKKIRKKFGYRVPGPFDVEAEGLKFRVYPTENYCDRVMIGRLELPEQVERQMIRKLVRPDMVFVDVGANVGTYTIDLARQAGPQSTVLAFEPHPRTFAKLVFNCEANDTRQVRLINQAVGPAPDSAELWTDGGGNIGHASLLPEGAGKAVAHQTVDVVPLVQVLASEHIDRIDLLKIDVEGFEDRALLPLFDRAPSRLWPTGILLETVHNNLWEADLFDALDGLGYKVDGKTEENVLLLRDRLSDDE